MPMFQGTIPKGTDDFYSSIEAYEDADGRLFFGEIGNLSSHGFHWYAFVRTIEGKVTRVPLSYTKPDGTVVTVQFEHGRLILEPDGLFAVGFFMDGKKQVRARVAIPGFKPKNMANQELTLPPPIQATALEDTFARSEMKRAYERADEATRVAKAVREQLTDHLTNHPRYSMSEADLQKVKERYWNSWHQDRTWADIQETLNNPNHATVRLWKSLAEQYANPSAIPLKDVLRTIAAALNEAAERMT